jgi:hypothetical protein
MITNLVIRDFGLLGEEDDKPSEEVIFQMLCDKIAWLIEHNMEYLLSLLYRNDVPESKIYIALLPDNPDPANIALAKLVIERQKQRLETKKEFGKQDASDVEEELRW